MVCHVPWHQTDNSNQCRLVEALEDYEGGDGDGYSDVSAEQSLLSGGHKHGVCLSTDVQSHTQGCNPA